MTGSSFNGNQGIMDNSKWIDQEHWFTFSDWFSFKKIIEVQRKCKPIIREPHTILAQLCITVHDHVLKEAKMLSPSPMVQSWLWQKVTHYPSMISIKSTWSINVTWLQHHHHHQQHQDQEQHDPQLQRDQQLLLHQTSNAAQSMRSNV